MFIAKGMTLRRFNRQIHNNESICNVLLQLIDTQTKMNTSSIFIFIIIWLCLSIIMFSSFVVVDIILNPDDSYKNKINKLKRKYHEFYHEENDTIEKESIDSLEENDIIDKYYRGNNYSKKND
jgi:hypothetical protein